MSEPQKLKAGMKLFLPGNCKGKYFHLHSAVMSATIYPTPPGAFRRGAEMQLDAHLAASGPHNDKLLFPVLYNYRHGLELWLKELLLLGIRTGFFDEAQAEKLLDKEGGISKEHKLATLFHKAKGVLADNYPDDGQLRVAESMVNDLNQIDKDGQTLRYERTKGMELRRPRFQHLGVEQSGPVYKIPATIDLGNLRERMADLFHYLETSYRGILDKWVEEQQSMP
jgi:hypothetical protein